MSDVVERQPILRLELPTEAATFRLAQRLARQAAAGDVYALFGELGSGKTAFARAFVQALCGPNEEVPSPTFTLLQTYDAPNAVIHHFDLYRLEEPEDAFELDIDGAFAEGISLIEWPDRLGTLLPEKALELHLSHGAAEQERAVLLAGDTGWLDRIGRADLV